MCVGAYAKGGTYHHADPVFMKSPVIVKSNETTKKPMNATIHHFRRPLHKR
jgi:hypothetical protein